MEGGIKIDRKDQIVSPKRTYTRGLISREKLKQNVHRPKTVFLTDTQTDYTKSSGEFPVNTNELEAVVTSLTE